MPFKVHHNGAMTLTEVMIASAILITAIAMVMQGLIAGQQTTAMGNAQDDIAFDSDRVMAQIAADISLSGWDGAGGQAASNFAGDRGNYYLPYVYQQALPEAGGGPLLVEGLGTSFPHVRRDVNFVELDLPLTLRGDPEDANTNFDEDDPVQERRYQESFYARSQELLFLKIALGAWTATSEPLTNLRIPFLEGDWTNQSEANRDTLNILHPSAWRESAPNSGLYARRAGTNDAGGDPLPYGHIIQGGVLVVDGADLMLDPRWETLEEPPEGDLLPVQLAPLWREYQYAVVPSPIGLGRLVRAMKVRISSVPDPVAGVEIGQIITPLGETFGMQVQDVLSDNVVRIVFNTYRTDPTLEINQVGVRIYYARASVLNSNLVLTRVVSSVLAMRTRAAESDISTIQSFIPTSVGFDY